MWILIMVILVIWLIWEFNRPESERIKAIKGKLYYGCHYYGGFDDVSVKASYPLDLVLNDVNLNFLFINKDGTIKYNKIIKYSDIIKVKFMNKTNITKEISLGKMVCFGWLSLAMKDKKKHIEEYVVIEVNHENEIISIILEEWYGKNERLLKEIKDKIEKAKENNMDIESV